MSFGSKDYIKYIHTAQRIASGNLWWECFMSSRARWRPAKDLDAVGSEEGRSGLSDSDARAELGSWRQRAADWWGSVVNCCRELLLH